MQSSPTILREIHSPAAIAKIVEWRWPTPLDVTAREDAHMLEMSLPPLAADGTAAFPDIAPGRFSFMGNMFLRPAGVTVQARSVGGRVQIVRCEIDPQHFNTTVEREFDWTESELRTCVNLRNDTLKTLFRRLNDELVNPGLASAAFVEACSTALMIEAARTIEAGEERRAEGRLAAWQYRRIADRLAQEDSTPTVQELAQLCGVSPRHLLRLYSNLAGESVIAHIERERTQRAKALLLDRDLPVKEVAARLGFANAGSFSSAFRRATGMTPRLFRQTGDAAKH